MLSSPGQLRPLERRSLPGAGMRVGIGTMRTVTPHRMRFNRPYGTTLVGGAVLEPSHEWLGYFRAVPRDWVVGNHRSRRLIPARRDVLTG